MSFSKKEGDFAKSPFFIRRVLPTFLLSILLIVAIWMAWPTLWVYIEAFAEQARHSPWRERILAYGLFAPLVSIGIMTAQLFPLPIPGPTIPIINGWLYGLWGGALITWLGLMSKGILGYLLGLGGGRIQLIQRRQEQLVARFKPYLERYGWRIVFIFSMLPLVPFTPISSGAALTGMPWSVYLLARAVGIVPLALFYAFIGTLLR